MGAEADAVRRWLAGAILVMLDSALPGCGGHGSGGVGSISGAAVPGRHSDGGNESAGIQPASPVARASLPAIQSGDTEAAASELVAYLSAEFSRLGIDPEKVAAAAPRGETNAVFDLAAAVVDPDGEGGDQPTGIALSWTERCIGDYDQNGLVNASDLTPLGVHWQEEVAYDAPSLHGGCDYWPQGDPDDDDAGTDNWRCARIDGNDNGLIEVADITPIAQHFKERLSGYRVYRRGPLDADWVLLPDPLGGSIALSIERPPAQVTAPVRYTFTDSPGYPGLYEYYVIAYALGSTGVSAMEGEEASNIAQALLVLEGVDVYPPVWQGTEGISAATANEDGTVTVEWGDAVEEEHPPAPASPPVSYSVYYGAETPLDFVSAAKIENATSPWLSPQLVNGQEYYFTVRARDSAAVPNEDQNTNELAATVTGGIVDDEPPVWTETWTVQIDDENTVEYAVEGIRELQVGDRKLTITCADAGDELSPPVHYDLYYIPRIVSDDIFVHHGGGLHDIHPDAQVIRDIPKVYEFEWPNRNLVRVTVQARDSATPCNETLALHSAASTPTKLKRIKLDMNIPDMAGVDPAVHHQVNELKIFDRFSRTRFISYYQTYWDEEVRTRNIWVLALNMVTGEWNAELVDSFAPEDGNAELCEMEVSPTGEVWLDVYESICADNSVHHFYCRSTSGSWQEWNPPDRKGTWMGDFAPNNLPVMYEIAASEVNPADQWRLSYRWWDEDAQQWHSEDVCDPSGWEYVRSVVRPDGVVQLATFDDLAFMADPVPLYGHIHERSVEGEWSEVFRVQGHISITYDMPYWGCEWAWVGGVLYGSFPNYTDQKILTYGTSGYEFHDLTLQDWTGRHVYGNWPAPGGYHCLPSDIYFKGELVDCSSRHYELTCKNNELFVSHEIVPNNLESGSDFDASTGWYAELSSCYDIINHTVQVYLYTAGPGDSVFDPEVD